MKELDLKEHRFEKKTFYFFLKKTNPQWSSLTSTILSKVDDSVTKVEINDDEYDQNIQFQFFHLFSSVHGMLSLLVLI